MTVHQVKNAEGFSVARVNVSDSHEQPVFVSLGVGAKMGCYLTVKEAKHLVDALNKTLKEFP
jgi:hypothetical protein